MASNRRVAIFHFVMTKRYDAEEREESKERRHATQRVITSYSLPVDPSLMGAVVHDKDRHPANVLN